MFMEKMFFLPKESIFYSRNLSALSEVITKSLLFFLSRTLSASSDIIFMAVFCYRTAKTLPFVPAVGWP